MANSYTQIYIQYVFSVKGRMNFIKAEIREDLHKYITGIVNKRNCKTIAINSVPDHLHFLVRMHPSYAVAKLIQEVKAISSKFLNDNHYYRPKFRWQSGYGAFSYSPSQISRVVKYIANQQEHHRKKTFKDEYFEFLEKFNIKFENEYLFEFYD